MDGVALKVATGVLKSVHCIWLVSANESWIPIYLNAFHLKCPKFI